MNFKPNRVLRGTFTFFCIICLWLTNSLTARALPALTDESEKQAIPVETNAVPNWPEGPIVSAQSAILMDADTGVILYAKNIHEQLYPASTTKLLTGVIAMERCSLDEIVTFSYDAVFDTPRDSSNIAMDVGYELTMEECLQALLIASANEVAYAMAEHIAGTSWEDFAPIMNEKAAELGCVDSHFTNPNGLPDEDHYSSAYDLAMIGRAFFANELLCKLSSMTRLELIPTDKQPKHVLANSPNQLLAGKTYAYEYLVGSKTGYIDSARSTLISCAEKNGLKLIAVVLAEESPAQFLDTIALFNYGFSNFEKLNIYDTETRFNIDNTGFFYSDNDIFGNSKPILSLNKSDCILLPKTLSFSDVASSISYDTQDAGQAAVITYSYEGQYLGSVSVDFVKNENSYAFETDSSQNAVEVSSQTGSNTKIIFINVLKVFFWIGAVAGVLILLVFIRSFLINYEFGDKNKNNRRNWQRDRRKKRNRYQISKQNRAALEAELRNQPKRRKRPKRPNRFRDFDY